MDAKPNEGEGELIESEMFKQAEELFRKGFKRLLQFERWDVCKELLQFFILKAKDINPGVEPLIIPLTNEILISRTTFKLNNLLTKISENEGLN